VLLAFNACWLQADLVLKVGMHALNLTGCSQAWVEVNEAFIATVSAYVMCIPKLPELLTLLPFGNRCLASGFVAEWQFLSWPLTVLNLQETHDQLLSAVAFPE